MQKIVKFIEREIIVPFLRISPLKATGDKNYVYLVWQQFRNIANILLVLVFFVIIFSQALSINIDAYAVKKIMPRLVIATIIVQLSFFLCSLAVDITNVLGNGIGGIVTDIVGDGGPSLDISGGAGLFSGLAVSGGILFGGLAIASAAASGAIFAVLIPLVLACLAVMFTIIFRQMLIYILVVLSPIALLAWVLPNTERLFKMWWNYLLRALMMYPLIVLLFAGAKLMAKISANTDSPANAGQAIIQAALVIAPLALVPQTFQFAGGAISAVSGKFSQWASKGGGAASKKIREASQERKGRIQSGHYLAHREGFRGRLAAGANRALQIGSNPMTLNKKGKSYAKARDSANAHATHAAQEMQKDKHVNYHVNNEFAAAGGDKKKVKSRIEQLRSVVDEHGNAKTAEQQAQDRQTADGLETYLQRGYGGKAEYAQAAMMLSASQGKVTAEAVYGATHHMDAQTRAGVINDVNLQAKGNKQFDLVEGAMGYDEAGNFYSLKGGAEAGGHFYGLDTPEADDPHGHHVAHAARERALNGLADAQETMGSPDVYGTRSSGQQEMGHGYRVLADRAMSAKQAAETNLQALVDAGVATDAPEMQEAKAEVARADTKMQEVGKQVRDAHAVFAPEGQKVIEEAFADIMDTQHSTTKTRDPKVMAKNATTGEQPVLEYELKPDGVTPQLYKPDATGKLVPTDDADGRPRLLEKEVPLSWRDIIHGGGRGASMDEAAAAAGAAPPPPIGGDEGGGGG